MKTKKYLACSKIGRAAYCPHSVRLDAQGIRSSEESLNRMKKGDAAHLKFNSDITQDKRCFVATVCFGIDDPTTQFFRDFRDRKLRPYWLGRCFISIYYLVSPILVWLVNSAPFSKQVSRYFLLLLKRHLEQDHA